MRLILPHYQVLVLNLSNLGSNLPLFKSKQFLMNNLTIYESIIHPVWLYGIQLWDIAKPSDTRTALGVSDHLPYLTPLFVTNHSLYKDLKMLSDLAKSH